MAEAQVGISLKVPVGLKKTIEDLAHLHNISQNMLINAVIMHCKSDLLDRDSRLTGEIQRKKREKQHQAWWRET